MSQPAPRDLHPLSQRRDSGTPSAPSGMCARKKKKTLSLLHRFYRSKQCAFLLAVLPHTIIQRIVLIGINALPTANGDFLCHGCATQNNAQQLARNSPDRLRKRTKSKSQNSSETRIYTTHSLLKSKRPLRLPILESKNASRTRFVFTFAPFLSRNNTTFKTPPTVSIVLKLLI